MFVVVLKTFWGNLSLVIQQTEHRLYEEHGSRWQHTAGYIDDTSQDPEAEMLVDHRECSEPFRALVPLPHRCLFSACLFEHLLAGHLPWRLAENVSPRMLRTQVPAVRYSQECGWQVRARRVSMNSHRAHLVLGWADIQSVWRPPKMSAVTGTLCFLPGCLAFCLLVLASLIVKLVTWIWLGVQLVSSVLPERRAR